MPAKNMIMASALIKCITLKLKLSGLLGSFFLKKYITQTYIFFLRPKTVPIYKVWGSKQKPIKTKKAPGYPEPSQ
jgi:hypothetical protein